MKQKEKDHFEIVSKINKIQEIFRENLDLIYKSFDTPVTQINQIRKFLKTLVVKAKNGTKLAKRLIFRSCSTYYEDRIETKTPFFFDLENFLKWSKNNKIPLFMVTLDSSFGTISPDGKVILNGTPAFEDNMELENIIKQQRKEKKTIFHF